MLLLHTHQIDPCSTYLYVRRRDGQWPCNAPYGTAIPPPHTYYNICQTYVCLLGHMGIWVVMLRIYVPHVDCLVGLDRLGPSMTMCEMKSIGFFGHCLVI